MSIEPLKNDVNEFRMLVEEARRNTVSWLQHLLLLCSAALGLLVTLETNIPCNPLARWLLALPIILFSLGMAAGVVALYGLKVGALIRGLEEHARRLLNAIDCGGGKVAPFSPVVKRRDEVCEILFYIFSSLAVLCLVARAIIGLI